MAVLGPMEVVSSTERLALGGPKQRLVLGLLAASRRRVVTLDELVDGLWPEGPHGQPRKTVQVYITRLRQTLGDNGDAIHSEAAGYRLDTDRLPVDADQFEAELLAANTGMDDDSAAELLRVALQRWHGDAFADLRDCPALVPSAVRLDEMRLTAMYELFDREVRHRPRAVISELEQAVESNPLHEGFAAQLMTAQYRSGRQADALATFQILRRRLGDELGLEPGRAVRELEGQILRHELPIAAASPTSATERQRRRVTVLAMEITVGSTDDAGELDPLDPLDPEDEMTTTAPLRQAARAQILQRGGIVIAEAGDAITACFGYPARDRSVEHAVRAGLAIRDLCRAGGGIHNVDARIGVDTGVVVVEAGGDLGEFIAIAGGPVRTATHLRDRSRPGNVLVGLETAGAVAGAIELAPTAAGTVAVDVLHIENDTASARPGLVGRDSATRNLAALVADCRHRVCAVVVSGPPGIGKSALVDGFVAGLDDPGPALRVHCDRRHDVIPLNPFRSVLGRLFDDGAVPSPRAVVTALGDRWTGLPILVVEDVDAADPATIDVLTTLYERLSDGVLVLTSRSDRAFELGGDVLPAVRVGSLDRVQSRQVAVAVAGARRLPLDTLNEIVDRSGGVPLYIAALTRATVEGTDGQPVSVPASLYDSLMADLDRLGPARVIVQQCSVLGTAFTTADLELLGGSRPDAAALRDHLATAVDRGVLIAESEGHFRFAHELTAAAAYESMLKAERVSLHASIADSLPAAVARTEPERVAFHLEAAGRTFEAGVAWRRASSRAVRTNRHWEAQHHARRALRLLDSLPDDAQPDRGDNHRRALVNLAIALQATSHGSAELFGVIEQLKDRELDTVDPPSSVVVGLIDVSNRQASGDFAGAERVARATLAAAEQIDAPSEAFARQFLGATLVWQGNLVGGIIELETAAAFWDRRDVPSATAARTHGALWSQLGLAASFQGRAEEAGELLGRAAATIPVDDGYGRCLVAAMAATVDQLSGRTDVVRAAVEPVWSLAMDLSSDFWMRWAQMLLGWSMAGDPSEDAARGGVALMAEALDDTKAALQAVPYFSYLLASRLGEHGRPMEGIERVDAGLAVAAESGENVWVPLLHLARARCLAATGADAGALAAAAARGSALASAMGATMVVEQCDEWIQGVGA